jgi:hypothetical protein
MNKIYISACCFLFAINHIQSQSFEAMDIENVTTTISGSRSANFVDVNGDGWDDIFFSNGPSGGQNNMLYINNTDGTFTTIIGDDIVKDGSSSDGTSFADVDNDGDLDAFVVTWASGNAGKNYFYRNNGNGSFTYDPDIAMGSVLTFSEMATWIDANNDQFLDLYFTNSAGSVRNSYYENQGDGTFSPVADIQIVNEVKGTRSVDWIDYDGDGDCDLYLTNENNAKNSLYKNNGPNDFTKIKTLSIVQDYNNSGGSSWGDIDNDGDYDLFVANWKEQTNQLFINNNGEFTEQSTSVIASGGGNSFGSSFADLDNDGDLDLFVCNAFSSNQTNNFVYINDGHGVFTQDNTSILASQEGWTFGCAFGDYDNNGWLDLILANTLNESQKNALFRNTGTGNNWVKFNCSGVVSNSSAVGAKVRIKANINGNEVWQTRQISASSGYNSQDSYTVHFGLGDATIIEELEITWPIGNVEIHKNLSINKTHNIIEGSILDVSEFIKDSNLLLFPNPVQDLLKLKVNFTKSINDLTFKIMNINGEQVKLFSGLNSNSQSLYKEFDVSNLHAGTYFYALIKSNGQPLISGKLLKVD